MRKYNYLVGFKGERQCVYGHNFQRTGLEPLELLTFEQAKTAVKLHVQTCHVEKCGHFRVYELVEVGKECQECGKTFYGERNTCVECRKKRRKEHNPIEFTDWENQEQEGEYRKKAEGELNER